MTQVRNMTWYSIHVVFENCISGNLGPDPLCEDRVVLFLAVDEESAREAAVGYGEAEQTQYRNEAGELVEWKFARIAGVEDVGSEPVGSGWRLPSDISDRPTSHTSKHRRAMAKVQRKDELTLGSRRVLKTV